MNLDQQIAILETKIQTADQKLVRAEVTIESVINTLEEQFGIEVDDPTKFNADEIRNKLVEEKNTLESRITDLLDEAEGILNGV